MKKLLFIMNPYSGMRRAVKYLAEIISLFNRSGYTVITHMTSGTGDASKAAQRLAPEVDLIVCCGGDGTLNETITGMLLAGVDVPIGYIPSGSTNDFANSVKLSMNIMQATKDIMEGVPVPYDVGRFGDRYFTYIASFGAFTRTSYSTPQNVKNALGHTAYVLEGINELSQLKAEHVRIEIDDILVEDDFLFGAISNSTSLGGVLTLDPSVVDVADGLMEVLLVRAPRTLMEIPECIQAVQSQKYNCSMITFRSARKVKIYANPDMPWTLDGEREDGHAEVTAENIHHGIRLMRRVEQNA